MFVEGDYVGIVWNCGEDCGVFVEDGVGVIVFFVVCVGFEFD